MLPKQYNTFLFILTIVFFIGSCKDKSEPIVVTTDDFHSAVDNVIKVMIHDIFSPPVASRVFAYPNIAAYEIIAQNDSTYNSLKGQIKSLKAIPKANPEKKNKLSACGHCCTYGFK